MGQLFDIYELLLVVEGNVVDYGKVCGKFAKCAADVWTLFLAKRAMSVNPDSCIHRTEQSKHLCNSL